MQLEEALRSLEHTHIGAAARAAGLADEDTDDDEAASAALRAKHHVRPAYARGSPKALTKMRGFSCVCRLLPSIEVWATTVYVSNYRSDGVLTLMSRWN